jgi:THO complex subunit 3
MEDLQKYFQSHQDKKDFVGHSSKVHSVAWSCEGKWLATGSPDKTVCVFHLDRHKLTKETSLKGHSDSVDQLCWSPVHHSQLVSASGDKSVKVWDIRSGRCTHTIQTKGENINVCWSPDGQAVAVGNKEDLVTIIDMKTYKIVREEQFKYEVNEMSWDRSGSQFYLTNGLGCIVVLSYPDLTHLHTIPAHPANCICIDFDPKGK